MAEGEQTEGERSYTLNIKIILPRETAATLDGIAGYRGLTRSQLFQELSLWGLESVEKTELPEVHPVTERTKREILNRPRTGKPWLK